MSTRGLIFYLAWRGQGWSPFFCATQAQSGECKALPNSWAAQNLALHGLWPQYATVEDGSHEWPQVRRWLAAAGPATLYAWETLAP